MTDKEMLFEENFTCLLAAGTSEGLEVMRVLDKLHIKTAACVATELGAKMLRETGACVFVGRMDKAGFEKFISAHKVHFVIDATHPFAVEVTKNLKGAAEACGVSYARYIRKTQDYHYEKIIHAADAREAAVRLLEMPGNILLTTGANTAPIYKEILPDFNERAYVRVLNTESSRLACKDAGIDEGHVIAQNPPFSPEDNKALIEQYHIEVLVSKDSGERGGLLEKIESAKAFSIPVVLIDRPECEDGLESAEAILKWLECMQKGQTLNMI